MPQREVLWHLTVQTSRIDEVAVLTIVGRMSHATAPLLATPLASVIPSGTDVVLDVSGIDYINSAGLQLLESSAARLASIGRRLIVCGVHDAVRPVFDLAGVIPDLEFADTVQDAIAKSCAKKGTSPEPPGPAGSA